MPGLPIIDDAPAAPELPTVRALEKLWDEVAQKPLWAPPNLLRYLRLRRQIDLRFVDARRVEVLAPAGKLNDCASCTDICCVGPKSTVLLRLRDIATLIDIGRTELMTQQKPSFSDEQLDARPALRLHVGSDAWRRFPVLRQNSFGACAALGDDGKCGLYPHWPLSCARFPYALHLDRSSVYYSSRCDSFWIHPEARGRASEMAQAAVAAYNERIKDAILLAYAPERLASLGLSTYLSAI